MKTPKCSNVFHRHRWQEDKTCARCGKERNPNAGDKMFRSLKKEYIVCANPIVAPEVE